ncbi:hypothetical protein SAMN05421820_107290 [Pedobacter steynii]|uniref:Uncharacterized protein n=1 Tax=Pedobacter steynii TaxID=430522 RepID=A0A1H0B308_9SPHI|nr:hypothetical protein [Pedobacter steynii]NQX41175.1 hypothetical protein [Pedobacter steynii]SDN40052.1 hypothetical protein SAMN05421820_107290 [Pedobacter steynii]
MMSNTIFFRSFIAAILFIWLPPGTFARDTTTTSLISNHNLYQDKRDKKQERGKENKKPDVKEVPQSRRQEKPGEVKPEKREAPSKENKRRND